jgi:hypothetical protein
MGFDRTFEQTIGLEGGFSRDADDNGSWTGGRKGLGDLKGTKYGISAAQYPSLDIEHLIKYLDELLRGYFDTNRAALLLLGFLALRAFCGL